MQIKVIEGKVFKVSVVKGLLVLKEIPYEIVEENKDKLLKLFNSRELLEEAIKRNEKKDD